CCGKLRKLLRSLWRKQSIPPKLDELGPFGFLAQRNAGNALEERFFLHAAGIRNDQSCVPFQHEHIEISGRINQESAGRGEALLQFRNKSTASAWMQRQHDADVFAEFGEALENSLEVVSYVGILGAMDGRQGEAFRCELVLIKNRALAFGF